MSLRQAVSQISSREYQLWLWYLESEWDRPSRSDQYLMQVAAEVRRSYVKDPRKVRLEDFRLQFNVRQSKPTWNSLSEAEKQRRSAWHKQMWLGIVSGRE